jgi:hypothetical protein
MPGAICTGSSGEMNTASMCNQIMLWFIFDAIASKIVEKDNNQKSVFRELPVSLESSQNPVNATNSSKLQVSLESRCWQRQQVDDGASIQEARLCRRQSNQISSNWQSILCSLKLRSSL